MNSTYFLINCKLPLHPLRITEYEKQPAMLNKVFKTLQRFLIGWID